MSIPPAVRDNRRLRTSLLRISLHNDANGIEYLERNK